MTKASLSKNQISKAVVLIAVGLATSICHTNAIPMIINGDFETGDFTGWTNTGSNSGLAFAINDGTFDPAGPSGPLAPIGGNFDAVSSQTGPGLNLVTQSILVPNGITSATLGWSDRIQNQASAFSDPNQEFRVEIQDPFGSTISQVFSTNPGDPLIQTGPNNRVFDVTGLFQSLEGQTIHVAFEQQDNLGFFNATIDNVSLDVVTSEVPESGSSVWLLGAGLLALGIAASKRVKLMV